jgi:pimeloyl-ACP methyl ester carboxylesterase
MLGRCEHSGRSFAAVFQKPAAKLGQLPGLRVTITYFSNGMLHAQGMRLVDGEFRKTNRGLSNQIAVQSRKDYQSSRVRKAAQCLRVTTPMSTSDALWRTDGIEQRQVQTSKGSVEYADVGQGIPILYFHGNGTGNDAALMMEKSLLDEGFRLIAPNRPGYYGTSLECGRSHNDCADLAAELLEQLHIERVVVIGTSGGGPAASRFAARHPQRTIALVLQCALSHPFDSGRWMPRGLGWFLPVFRHLSVFLPVLRFGHRRQTRKLVRGDFVANCMSKDRFAELRTSPSLQSLGSLLAGSMIRCAERPDGIENDWANWTGEPWLTPDCIDCPTLVLHDRADSVVPVAHAEWAMHCIPSAQFCDLHTGGHLIWVGRDHDKMRSERATFIRRHFDKSA